MANPNLYVTSGLSCYATTMVNALTTAQVAVLSLSTGQVARLNEVTIANLTTNQVTALVKQYTGASLGGTGYQIIPTITIPPNSSLVAIDRSMGKYLTENQSLGANASAASSLELTGSADIVS